MNLWDLQKWSRYFLTGGGFLRGRRTGWCYYEEKESKIIWKKKEEKEGRNLR
jgi:hypothetical protein